MAAAQMGFVLHVTWLGSDRENGRVPAVLREMPLDSDVPVHRAGALRRKIERDEQQSFHAPPVIRQRT